MAKTVFEIDYVAIKELRKELNDLEPGLARQLTKDLKSALSGPASIIQNRMPKEAPLSRLVRGDKVWSPSKVKVSATPGAGFGKPMAVIYAEGSPNKAMAKIVEFAGKGKKNYVTGNRGRALIRNLDAQQGSNPKEGRYFFSAYRLRASEMRMAFQGVIDKYIDIANRKIN
jgi:hypothetical protein